MNSAVFNFDGSTASTIKKLAPVISRANLSDPQMKDWGKIKARLDELCSLQYGWDGYAGVPIRFEIAYFVVEILKNVLSDHTTALDTQLIPGSDGDIQIEWHQDGAIVELHVKAPYDVTAWRSNPISDEGEELYLRADYTVVRSWLTELANSQNNAAAAA